MSFDSTLFHLLNNLAGKSGVLDFFGIFFASYFPYIVALAAMIIILWDRNWKTRFEHAAFAALTLLLSRGLFVTVIRFFYVRPRPFVAFPEIVKLITQSAAEASFPSGHAAVFFALAAVFYYIHRKWFRYFLAAAIIIGIARVFVGVHYPLDIVAGALIGWGSAWAVSRIMKHGAWNNGTNGVNRNLTGGDV